MSEPTPTSRRQQAARPHCAMCGEATGEPIAFGMVRPSLATGLVAAHPQLKADDVICRKHLTEQRTRYVEQLLERERGELSDLERQVRELGTRRNGRSGRRGDVGRKAHLRRASF